MVRVFASGLIDLIDTEGNWKVDLLRPFLPNMILDEIMVCFPPSSALGMDKFVWALMSDGRFSTKPAYDLLACPNVQSDPSLRNCLWKIPGRPRARDLPKNKYRHIRGMAEHNDWPLCDLEPESELHLL